LTLYLDVDAVPCSARGVTTLVRRLFDSGAAVANPVIDGKHVQCQASRSNCSHPHPLGLSTGELEEWRNFGERNAGVMVVDMRKARQMIEDWAHNILETAGSGKVLGDQFALRMALFKHRHDVKQAVLPRQDVCRYREEEQQCATEDPSASLEGTGGGCLVHHGFDGRSLQLFGIAR